MEARVFLVIGSGLRPGVAEEFGLRPLGEARTTPRYRLLSLEDRWAALVPAAEDGVAVEGMLCEVDDERWAALLASEPPGVTQRPVELEDGREGATAAFADASAHARAIDISLHGGFSRTSRPATRRSRQTGSRPPSAARFVPARRTREQPLVHRHDTRSRDIRR